MFVRESDRWRASFHAEAAIVDPSEALKNWSGEGCDVKSVELADAAATMLSQTIGILTFTARADGSCFGQKVGPVWGSPIYVKVASGWKWNFGINVPSRVRDGDG